MSTAIQKYEDSGSYLTQWREPEEVLAEATKAAVALRKVVAMKKNPVIFNKEQYLEREDWGTVAKFYGCTAKATETRYVEFGNVRGWEATAVVIDRNMNEIGRAESMCLSDEDNWGEVPVYVWEDEIGENGKKVWDAEKKRYKGKRVQTGTKPKPLFQLRSMAQTRAEAKALKGVFSWVVVLAGYQPTPAEEMTGNEQFEDREERKPPVTQPSRASEKKAEAPKEESKPGEVKLERISGTIETLKEGKDGAVWIIVAKKTVLIVADRVDDEIHVGNLFTADCLKKASARIGDYWEAKIILESPKTEEIQDAEIIEETTDPVANFSPLPAGAPTLDDLKATGAVTTANKIESPKTIGLNRAKRLYIIARNNEANTGFTEPQIKKLLSVLPKPLEHLRDLESGMYKKFEEFALGEDSSWKTLIEESGK